MKSKEQYGGVGEDELFFLGVDAGWGIHSVGEFKLDEGMVPGLSPVVDRLDGEDPVAALDSLLEHSLDRIQVRDGRIILEESSSNSIKREAYVNFCEISMLLSRK